LQSEANECVGALELAKKTDLPIPARETAEGIVIAVRLTPRASKDDVAGIENGADGQTFLIARVKAVPEKGKANAALATLIAAWLDLPKSACEIVGGGKSRMKQVLVRGDVGELKARLAKQTGKFDL